MNLIAQGRGFVEGGLSTRAHIVIAVATAVSLFMIFRLVRRRRMASKYALLWTGVGLFLGVLAVWPGLLTFVSETAGVYYPPALFLLVSTAFLFIVVIQFSYELSRMEDRSRTLAEEVALLRAELQVALEDRAAATDAADAVGPAADDEVSPRG